MRWMMQILPAIFEIASGLSLQARINHNHTSRVPNVVLKMNRGGAAAGLLSRSDKTSLPPLVLIGDRELLTPCDPCDPSDVSRLIRNTSRSENNSIDDFNNFRIKLSELKECQKHYGGIGIAACQVGWRTRIFSMGIDEGDNAARDRYPDAKPFPQQIWINPTLTPRPEFGTSWFWEGCLSVPGMRGWVERPNVVHLEGWNERGEPIEAEMDGLPARVAQHEFDHLDGILFTDRALSGTLLPVKAFEENRQEKWPEDWPTPGARRTKPGGFSKTK